MKRQSAPLVDPIALGANPFFSGLLQDELEKVAPLISVNTFERGQLIIHYGEPAEELFFVQKGLVRVYRLNESGTQVVLALLNQGDFFGEMGLFTDSVRTAWIEAVTKVKAYRMHKNDFRNLLLTSPGLCWRMLSVLSQRLAKMDEQMESFVCLSVEERLLGALFSLAKELGQNDGDGWMLPSYLTHELLAELIGTSRETVTRALGRLEKKGQLSRDENTIKVHAPADRLDPPPFGE